MPLVFALDAALSILLEKMMTWCVVLLKRHSSIVRVPGRYVLSSIDVVRCFIEATLKHSKARLFPEGTKA